MNIVRVPYNLTKHDAEILKFEWQYGVPSDRLCDAFRREDGSLDETRDFLRWSLLWSIEKRRRR